MIERKQNPSFCPPFECFRFDSAVYQAECGYREIKILTVPVGPSEGKLLS